MKTVERVIVIVVSIIVGFVISLVWTNEMRPPKSKELKGIACGVVTPSGIAETFSGESKNIHISEFGVITSDKFVYTPASGEVCVLVKE